MPRTANAVAAYLKSLPPDRRKTIKTVRKVILANLPEGYQETLLDDLNGYVVPPRLYPPGYPCDHSIPLPFATLGSQKKHMALYLLNVYADAATEQWFREAWLATGKKLDMGKACLRFKTIEDLSLPVVGAVIARTPVTQYITWFEKLAAQRKKRQ